MNRPNAIIGFCKNLLELVEKLCVVLKLILSFTYLDLPSLAADVKELPYLPSFILYKGTNNKSVNLVVDVKNYY